MGPSREACDRCHSMKTRCVRAPQTQICNRCNRLGVSCNYSPAGRTGRPLGSRSARASSSNNNNNSSSSNSSNSQDHHPSQPPQPQNCHTSSMDVSMAPATSAAMTATATNPTTTTSSAAGDLPTAPHADPMHAVDYFIGRHLSSADEDGVSDSFVDSLTFDGSYPLSLDPVNLTNFDPSTLSLSSEPTLLGDGDGPRAPSLCGSTDVGGVSAAAAAAVDDESRLSRLLEIQARLGKLVKSLTTGLNVTHDIEDTYRASETLMDIVGGMQASPARPTGSVALLLSSCYFTLIHAYELLAALLRDEMRKSPRLPDTISADALSDAAPRDMGMPGMPGITVGAVRLAMPREAVAAVNLHLITRIVQHVKDSMQHFAARMAASSPSMAPQQLHHTTPSPGHMPFDKDPSASAPGCDAIVSLAAVAQSELRRREENLLATLRQTTSQPSDSPWGEPR